MNTQLPLFYSLNNGKYNDVSNIALDINLPRKESTETIVHQKVSGEFAYLSKMPHKSFFVGSIKNGKFQHIWN